MVRETIISQVRTHSLGGLDIVVTISSPTQHHAGGCIPLHSRVPGMR